MKDYNQKLNELKEEANDIVASIKDYEFKNAITEAFNDVDEALDKIIGINYQLNDLAEKWLPHRREKKKLENDEEELYSLIEGLVKVLNSYSEDIKKKNKLNDAAKNIRKKVALTKDYVDDFWDEEVRRERDRDVGDPYWRSKRRS